jgi:hypothetical protein
MGKGATRGKQAGNLARRFIGVCPSCGTTSIKLLYSQTINGQAVKVCKKCRHLKSA